VPQNSDDDAEKLAVVKSMWTSAQPLLGSPAERYLDETRGIDVSKLPSDIHHSLRFHPSRAFGSGTHDHDQRDRREPREQTDNDQGAADRRASQSTEPIVRYRSFNSFGPSRSCGSGLCRPGLHGPYCDVPCRDHEAGHAVLAKKQGAKVSRVAATTTSSSSHVQ
jgi:hypothetical protein